MNTIDWKNASPKQINLWNIVNAFFAPTVITPFRYYGVVAGSEYITYAANKLYFVLDIKFASSTSVGAGIPMATFYQENNTPIFFTQYLNTFYNAGTAAINYSALNAEFYDIYFSRFTISLYDYVMINGYKLTKP